MPVAKKPRAAARPLKAAAPRRAPSPGSEAALSAAQAMVYEAYEQPTKAKRVACARKALAISPYCADAYVILAQHAATPAEAVHLYTQGVEAGRTALGPHGFDEYEGEFWGFLETRPYMRARAGLAMALLRMGQTDAAMGHLGDMLRLNPNDNQGLRYILLGCLMEKNDLEGARDLLKAPLSRRQPILDLHGTFVALPIRRDGLLQGKRRARRCPGVECTCAGDARRKDSACGVQ
jgi:tetratricopeptide (TPR) repeat protein